MIEQKTKELFKKLDMTYPAVAIKYHYLRPENVEQFEGELSFCQFVRNVQDTGRHFYITKENDNCFGKVALGMSKKPVMAAAGLAGVAFGVYKTPAPNARLHNTYPVPVEGSIRYVEFCPVETCDFDPDLIICVADNRQADILFRSTSYISGDLWEQKVSSVMSCAWLYSYTYLSGKMNFCITGLHHGVKRRKVYPPGLFIIALPYQKLGEVFESLEEMPWELPAMSDDPKVKAELARKLEGWKSVEE